MKRRHNMPFGAEYRDDRSVRFRLWAPAARKVAVCLYGEQKSVQLSMEKHDEGWFELITARCAPGAEYYFQIDDARRVPDPASRFQPRDVHGPSEVIAAQAFRWRDTVWRGRRWEEAVTYEVHIGAFTQAGTFSAATERLDYLADLGVTALELMPVADFPGKRNWGYDGVFPYAPDSTYGRPEELKHLIQSAHECGIMVLLDVVYNHFGPEGNYLGIYAPQFVSTRHRTPWGNGMNYDGPQSRTVRDFFIHNALYWLTEYHFDGLRLDAVHAIADDSTPHILWELADTVQNSIAQDRYVHLILENDRNESRYLRRNACSQPRAYTAQWNDDIHHALHVLTTSEKDGYYSDYALSPIDQLGRCLVAGFAYQGESSQHRKGAFRGESTANLPLTAFVSFLQNHDQIGNRAFGERITKIASHQAVRAAVEVLLLAPSPPLLFMGEEFGADTPFLFFCDFEKDLAQAVTTGRRNEFTEFSAFNDPAERQKIPDPSAAATFEGSRLNWSETAQPDHQHWLRIYKHLLNIRCQHVVPHLVDGCPVRAEYQRSGDFGLTAQWRFPDNAELVLLANLGPTTLSDVKPPASRIIYASSGSAEALTQGTLPPWSVVWFLES